MDSSFRCWQRSRLASRAGHFTGGWSRRATGTRPLRPRIALAIVLLVLVIPLALAFSYATNEISTWVAWLIEANRNGVPVPESVVNMPFIGQWLAESWQRNLSEPRALGEVIQILSGEHVGNISRWVLATGRQAFNLVLSVLFIMITLFFVYKDGAAMVEQLDRVGERILPRRWQRFSRVVPATVSSTVTGMTLIAIGEGIVLGLAYKIAGVPSSFLLGVLTGFMAMIPGGAPLSVTLVSLYLLASGRPIAAVALFAWGAIELFIVDKTLRPKLVGGPIRLPFLPTLFGLIGGVKTMGMVGLFVGPVLMALLVAIWREWVLTTEAEVVDEAMRENSEGEIAMTPAPIVPSAARPSGVPRSRARWRARHAWPRHISDAPTKSSRARTPRSKGVIASEAAFRSHERGKVRSGGSLGAPARIQARAKLLALS